jgi:hypothetical protein
MPAPSLEVTIGDRGPATPRPGDVGTWFAAGLAARGPVGSATDCRSLEQVTNSYGAVVAYSHLIRTAEQYFRQGGSRMFVSRIVGPAATKGLLALSSAVPAVVMTVTAISAGDWSAGLTITVTAGTGSDRVVTFKDNGVALFSATFTSAAALQSAFVATGLVTAPLGVGSWPIAVLAETPLSTGTDDRASIPTTVNGWKAELDVFDVDLGVGSISLPGITTPAAHEALLRHFWTHKRWPLCDAIDTPTLASLTSPAGTLRALTAPVALGQILAPWIVVPYLTSTVNIPPSGAVAGRMARADHENRAGPAQPAAAGFGILNGVVNVTQEWRAQGDRDTLSEAGVTVIRNIAGRVQPYDALTIADPATYPQYAEASGDRVVLAIYSQALAILGQYVMRNIDGNRHVLAELEKDLVGICQDWYARDALYGDTAAEAFQVDAISEGVNPDAQLALRIIAAQIEVRTTPFAATVRLLITKVAAGDTI